MEDNLLTIAEAKLFLNISDSYLRELVRRGKIKVIRLSKRGDMRFDPKDIRDFIEKRKSK